MKTLRCCLLGLLFLIGEEQCLEAQSVNDPNEGSRLIWDSANSIYRFSWWGRSGKTYFLQQNEDLSSTWAYLPLIEPGNNTIKEWGFTTTGDRFFVRLRYTDIPTDDPEGDDFDGDGVSNADELLAGLDPFSMRDSDSDGLSDDWEIFRFGNLTHGPGTIEDGGTLTNKEQADLGLNPLVNESAAAGMRQNYTYDLVGRLTGATGPAASLGYTLDSEGNITGAQ